MHLIDTGDVQPGVSATVLLRAEPRTLRTWAKRWLAPGASALWIAWYRLRYRGHLVFGHRCLVNGRLVVRGPGRVILGDAVNAWAHAEKNAFFTFAPDAVIQIGAGTRLNGASITARCRVTIGCRCILGSAQIIDTDFHPVEPTLRHVPGLTGGTAPIDLGENVWLGGQSLILKGVRIGDNSVVGMRAVVRQDCPANVVVAGDPAHVVRHL